MRCNGGQCPNERVYWVTLERTGPERTLRQSIGMCAACTARFRQGATLPGGDRVSVVDVRTIGAP